MQRGLPRLQLNEMVETIVRNSPESMKLFTREINVDQVARETLNMLSLDDRSITPDELRRVQRQVEQELRDSLVRKEREVQYELREARRFIIESVGGSSPEELRVIAEIDFTDLMDELTGDVPAPVRQFVLEVDVPSLVEEALTSSAL